MSQADKEKWDRKYRQKPALLQDRPASKLLQRYAKEASGSVAIDLACGNGRNTLFLAKEGFHVDAVDISEVALSNLKEKVDGLNVQLIACDLDDFTPEAGRYDLAVMTNYLDRALILRTAEVLKPGALFIIETYMAHPENEKKDSNPDFLLAKEELLAMFDKGAYEVLAYEEFLNEPHELYRMYKEAIVVKKRHS